MFRSEIIRKESSVKAATAVAGFVMGTLFVSVVAVAATFVLAKMAVATAFVWGAMEGEAATSLSLIAATGASVGFSDDGVFVSCATPWLPAMASSTSASPALWNKLFALRFRRVEWL
jgi:hypothetical protein